jgi:hypothetical protein
MFKGFSDSSRNKEFHGFPNLNFQMNNEAYGFSGCTFWLDAAYGLNTQTNLAAIATWKEKIRGFDYVQGTAGNQPRLLTSDATFNNLPVIELQSNVRALVAGVAYGYDTRKTLAVVFQKISGPVTTSPYRGQVIGSAAGTPAYSGINFNIQSNIDSGGVGFTSGGTFQHTSATPFDTNPHIIIVNNSVYVADGATPTSTLSGVDTAGPFDAIGGTTNRTGFAGKIAEILVFDQTLNSVEAIRLCNNINQKYAIY